MKQQTEKQPDNPASGNRTADTRTARRSARLILEDGTEFSGWSFGKARSQAGEVVFASVMTGFPLTLTDPGYRGQILVSSYPIVSDSTVPVNPKTGEVTLDGYGLPLQLESGAIQISGFAVSEICEEPKTEAQGITISDWLEKSNVPGIYGIDTRELVQRLRNQGIMRGKILVEGSRDVTLDSGTAASPADEVSVKEIVTYQPARKKKAPYKIALIDCGVKADIIRCLLDRNAQVIRLPWNHDPMETEFDGLVISGG
ncbi:MAG: carbamoyl-phosphate synthase (glutamine-hydrolyzing) small subunit, partial [Treponema sp.]|nr:carbamoyl-phosphate synthase (glutamine-hydrolyzing) small subunit [Treponema sp.]